MRSIALTVLFALTAACSSTPQAASTTPTTDVKTSDDPCPEGPAATPLVAQTDQISADLMDLANAAKNCEYENGYFKYDCPAYKEWRSENEDLFEGASGNATLLSMLENTDVRMRALAADRGFSMGRAFFADKKRAERLLAVIDKERESRILTQYGRFIAHIDGEKILGKELQALAKHPSTELRRAYAEYALPQHATAFSLDLVKVFLDDPDASVRRAAMRSLSASGRTRPTEAICATLKTQLARTDKLLDEALDAASTSKCKGMAELVIAEAEKRVADASKKSDDIESLSSPLSSICWRSSTPEELKKKAFDVSVKAATKVDDPWRKRSFLYLFRNCDVARAKQALLPYTKDKNKDISSEAKDELARVEEELKRAK